MTISAEDRQAADILKKAANQKSLDIAGGKIRRTSSRFCFGVEHGDYNGTELFGVGTDRFIWLTYKKNGTNKIRISSENFPNDGVIEFDVNKIPQPKTIADSWARFPYGVIYILKKNGYKIDAGFDAVLYGNIPGGGMSRSASLTLNLMMTVFEVNNIEEKEDFKIIDMAQAVENEYIGSPCGQLDQIMIYFAKKDSGTYYNPKTKKIDYLPLGKDAVDFKIVSLDTGSVRPGLEKSTYKIRRQECQQLVETAKNKGFKIDCLADVKEQRLYDEMAAAFKDEYPHLCQRLKYIYNAQLRFYQMLDAWKDGDIEKLGEIFNADGIGLRDDYKISGPELEAMCDIARSVDGVLGARMLGGGDKGASGAIVRADAVEKLKKTVAEKYPKICPEYADKFAVHSCNTVDGIKVLEQML